MSDGLHLDLKSSIQAPGSECPATALNLVTTVPDHLQSFAAWLDLNSPPLAMIAGMLELLGNELYRQGRFTEGNDVKYVAQSLREEQGQ